MGLYLENGEPNLKRGLGKKSGTLFGLVRVRIWVMLGFGLVLGFGGSVWLGFGSVLVG